MRAGSPTNKRKERLKKMEKYSVISRKEFPVFSGVLQYFPKALMAVAEHSKKGNDKHNPGEPLHWARHKSTDQADCIARHLIDIGPKWDQKDPETGSYHATALAWRALALLEVLLERQETTSIVVSTPYTLASDGAGGIQKIPVNQQISGAKHWCTGNDMCPTCRDDERKESWIAP
jgi:Domain of unknown function (DUF5664)